jgi:diphosphomevalonate decarboxylase
MQDAILIVSAGVKKVGSSAGHELMNNHAFAEARVQQANRHMLELHKILETGDFERFIEIVENEALSLHGLMLSSNPGYFLFEPNTVKIIEKIREFRKNTGIPICFTLDAGPNVHLLYPGNRRDEFTDWIKDELITFCHNNKWIDDGTGEGPVQLK